MKYIIIYYYIHTLAAGGTERQIEVVSSKLVRLVRLSAPALLLNELDHVVARGSLCLNVVSPMMPSLNLCGATRLRHAGERAKFCVRRDGPVCTIAECPEPRKNVVKRLVHGEHRNTGTQGPPVVPNVYFDVNRNAALIETGDHAARRKLLLGMQLTSSSYGQ